LAIEVQQLETFLWRGQLRYKCPAMVGPDTPCEFDSYSANLILKHMQSTHTAEAEAAATRTHLFNGSPTAEADMGEEPNIIVGETDINAAIGSRGLPDHGGSSTRGKRRRT